MKDSTLTKAELRQRLDVADEAVGIFRCKYERLAKEHDVLRQRLTTTEAENERLRGKLELAVTALSDLERREAREGRDG